MNRAGKIKTKIALNTNASFDYRSGISFRPRKERDRLFTAFRIQLGILRSGSFLRTSLIYLVISSFPHDFCAPYERFDGFLPNHY
jgi:hypothetical protein